MNFRPLLQEDSPEINLIPLIDVLLVVLIFLVASASFTHITQMQLALPQAQTEDSTAAQALRLAISQDGQYALDDQWLSDQQLDGITQALRRAARHQETPALIIYADAQSAHAHVVLALQAARAAGITHVSFATQRTP